MKIISVMGLAGGVGVTLTAAELAIEAKILGQKVIAVDLSPYASLRHDLLRGGFADAGFSVIEDVAQLFRPVEEARWGRYPLPVAGLLCPLDRKPSWLTRSDAGDLQMVYRQEAGAQHLDDQHLDGGNHLRDCLASLGRFYDTMVVDVPNASANQMATFFDLSDEVYLLSRQGEGGGDGIANWLQFIGRKPADRHPLVMAQAARAGEVEGRDWGAWIRRRVAELA